MPNEVYSFASYDEDVVTEYLARALASGLITEDRFKEQSHRKHRVFHAPRVFETIVNASSTPEAKERADKLLTLAKELGLMTKTINI